MKTDSNSDSKALLAGRDKLARDIATVAGDAGEMLKEFSDRKLQRARRALTQAQSAISGGASEFGAAAGDYVQVHPWRAMGAAGAAGLVIGLLLARR